MALPTPRSDYGAITYYGNTQAVVLDTFRNGAGQLRNYNAPGYDSNGRPCKTWVRERQRRLQAYTRMLERNDYSGRHPAGCQTATSALRPYAGYNKLFGERKYANNYPFIKNSSSLMDLPGEIRNRIYRLHLLADEPIELLARTSRTNFKGADKAERQARERFTKIRTSRLKFLRLSKTVNKEACDIFYGENEFRFTGQNGWTWLRGFMHVIGDLNAVRLRILTVHVPWQAEPDELSKGMGSYDTIIKALEGPKRQGMYTLQDYKNCADILNRAGNLKQLKLVLPANLEVQNVEDLKLDHSKFPDGLDITLTHLALVGWCQPGVNASQLPLTKSESYQVKKGRRFIVKRRNVVKLGDPRAYATAMGWEYEKIVIGADGSYNPEPLDHALSDCPWCGSQW